MPKIRPPKIRFPVLTPAEKSALGILLSLLLAGALLRAWERSGVSLGPVDDWDGLRRLVTRAPRPAGPFPCADASFGFSGAGGEGARDGFVKTGTAAARDARKGRSGSGKKSGPARPLDLNTATETQLTSLPGVGPSTARAIVAYRAGHGKFASPEDLMEVKGIGPRKFEALRPFVRVPGAIPEKAEESGP